MLLCIAQVGYSVATTVGASTEFQIFGQAVGMQASITGTLSHADTVSSASTDSNTETYTFEVSVDPMMMKHVKCYVVTSTVAMPFTETINIGTVERVVEGTWGGIVRGVVTMNVEREEQRNSVPPIAYLHAEVVEASMPM